MSAADVVGPQALPQLQEQVARIIAEAKAQGASACEVAVSVEQGLSTSVRQRRRGDPGNRGGRPGHCQARL
jgi:PmbA protein